MKTRRIKKTKKIISILGLKFISGIGIVFLIAGVGFYLYEVNSAAIKGFKIKDMERRVENLRAENKKLENNSAKYESITAMQEKTKKLQMVPSRLVEYVMVLSGDVAKK